MAFGIPNIERIVSNFLEGQTGITAIRSIEFEKNYLWTVDFVGGGDSLAAPEPFDGLFPASDVELKIASIVSDEFEFGQTSIKHPKSTNSKDLSITFYDDEKRTLQRWFTDWINLDILNNGKYISGLEDSHQADSTDSFSNQRRVYPIRHVRLALLDAYKRDILVHNFRVFPDGDLSFSGSQGSQATQFTLNFTIVEELNSKASPEGGFDFSVAKQLLGRFI